MILQPLEKNQFEKVLNMFHQAKSYLKENNINQWQNDYPNINSIEEDYLLKQGYVLTHNTNVIGYVAVSNIKEDLYNSFDHWSCNKDYVIIHRFVLDKQFRGDGISYIMFDKIKEHCLKENIYCVRIDTHPDNNAMLHILNKKNFIKKGTLQYPDGIRIVFEQCI